MSLNPIMFSTSFTRKALSNAVIHQPETIKPLKKFAGFTSGNATHQISNAGNCSIICNIIKGFSSIFQ